MARAASGAVYEAPKGTGRWHGKFTTSRGRKSVRLVTCHSKEAADARKTFIAEQLTRLSDAGRLEFADKLLELAAKAETRQLDRVRRGVDAIIAGDFERPVASAELHVAGPSFKEFAESWTSGELRSQFPDHVREKASVSDDIYRLKAHVFPLVGDVPIREFNTEHAELVMRALPEDRSAGTRRQVAQLLSRVLRLAVYPARIIERSPIPIGFLPKPSSPKGLSYLYPTEEQALLGCPSIPVIYRLFYGFLAREGMRSSEAGGLTWGDVDLEHGSVTLDENKTDDPRTWALGRDVVAALAAWKRLMAPNANAEDMLFTSGDERISVDHLAITFRGHLSKIQGVRAILFQKGPNRRPIRIHDLRATFVTLALSGGRAEAWVADRTGHKSSNMINTYRRAARTAAELNLGWLAPLNLAIPELRPIVDESSMAVANGRRLPRRTNQIRRQSANSRPFDTAQAPLGSGG